MQPLTKPFLPSHFQTWCEPPDEAGDEILRIVSAQRSITLKGRSFREFHRHVIPLLDGEHSFEDICIKTADMFDRADLESALALLRSQNIVVEHNQVFAAVPRLRPQLNYLHELTGDAPAAQSRLSQSRVVVFGLGAAGGSVMLTLAAAGVGRIIGVDHSAIAAPDVYFSPVFGPADIGRFRASAIVARIQMTAPDVHSSAVTDWVDTVEEIVPIIEGADFVISCLDPGMLNLALKLNRACRAKGTRWISGELDGVDVLAGPAFYSDSGPCFMCYRMRSVACSLNPHSRFSQEKHFDKIKVDTGSQRESHVFGAGLLANLLGAEAFNILSGLTGSFLDGRMISLNLATFNQQKHVILRKPGCPLCSELNDK